MADARYAVYRLYDASGYLLYVGATKNVAVRMSQHRADKPWWPEVDDARTVVAWFDSVDGAAAAEFEAIRSESPAHNVASTDGRQPQMYRITCSYRSCGLGMWGAGGRSSTQARVGGSGQASSDPRSAGCGS